MTKVKMITVKSSSYAWMRATNGRWVKVSLLRIQRALSKNIKLVNDQGRVNFTEYCLFRLREGREKQERTKLDGYCEQGRQCVCRGDALEERAGCGNWVVNGKAS